MPFKTNPATAQAVELVLGALPAPFFIFLCVNLVFVAFTPGMLESTSAGSVALMVLAVFGVFACLTLLTVMFYQGQISPDWVKVCVIEMSCGAVLGSLFVLGTFLGLVQTFFSGVPTEMALFTALLLLGLSATVVALNYLKVLKRRPA